MSGTTPLPENSQRRWLILGAAGQLGSALLATPRNRQDHIIGLTRAELDLCDRDAVISRVTELRPELVINAAAYTAVDQAESDAARAFAINANGAANIAEACACLRIPLIHVSTDYVFDGSKIGPYAEADASGPISVYGLSKLRGEQMVADRHERHAIIRTSWLFGIQGQNFVKTIAKLARDRDELRVVADQTGCPTPAADLSDAIFALGRLLLAEQSLSGLFHFAGAEPISWHGFAEAVVQEMAPTLARLPRVIATVTAEYPRPARRPRNSVLDCGKLARHGINQKSWLPALRSVVEAVSATDQQRSAPAATEAA